MGTCKVYFFSNVSSIEDICVSLSDVYTRAAWKILDIYQAELTLCSVNFPIVSGSEAPVPEIWGIPSLALFPG